MGEKDYSPLSSACARALSDKLYDKRKAAALEIEKMVKDFCSSENDECIAQLIKVLEEFALSHNPHSRKGGLIGLAAVAIGLGNKCIKPYVKSLFNPVFVCFNDANPNVRYYACESLYNVIRVSRSYILEYFNDIFGLLIRLTVDADQNVKSGAEMLDRIIKDIVIDNKGSFDLVSFIPILREKLYSTNHIAQTLVISWISVLQSIPELELLSFLPDIMDGLFFTLGTPKQEVKEMCQVVLCTFLQNCKQSPTSVNYSEIINILITHAHSKDFQVKLIALTWIHAFVSLSERRLFPHVSGILSAALPCLSFDCERSEKTRLLAEQISNSLLSLINTDDDDDDNDDDDVTAVSSAKDGDTFDLDLPSVIEILVRHLQDTPVPCKISVLHWLYLLHDKLPNKMHPHLDNLLAILLKMLSDPSDEVVLLVIQVLSQIASSNYKQQLCDKTEETTEENKRMEKNEYFEKLLQNLLQKFSVEKPLLEDRGHFIIRQLCVSLDSEKIYRTFAHLLQKEDNLSFASVMVQSLSTLLLTAKELFSLRTLLKKGETHESCDLFIELYKSWSHNPVATLTLCLLTQNYEHARTLVLLFGDLEITTEFLVEIDKLIQLLESPIFTFLRLELLNPINNQPLVEVLYGLLMLLPQSDVFTILRCRLNCVPPAHLLRSQTSQESRGSSYYKDIDFQLLLAHFMKVQKMHQVYQRNKYKLRLQTNAEALQT